MAYNQLTCKFVGGSLPSGRTTPYSPVRTGDRSHAKGVSPPVRVTVVAAQHGGIEVCRNRSARPLLSNGFCEQGADRAWKSFGFNQNPHDTHLKLSQGVTPCHPASVCDGCVTAIFREVRRGAKYLIILVEPRGIEPLTSAVRFRFQQPSASATITQYPVFSSGYLLSDPRVVPSRSRYPVR